MLKRIDIYIDRLLASYGQPDDYASLVRIAYALYYLIFFWPSAVWLTSIPDLLYYPPAISLGRFLFSDGFPSRELLFGLFCIQGIAAVALLFGVFTKASGIILCLATTLTLNFQYSLAKIDHVFLFVVVPAVLAFSNWGNRFALLPSKQKGARAFALLALFIGFGYFTAGLAKAPNWLDLDLSTCGVRAWWIDKNVSGTNESILDPLLRTLPTWGWEALDLSALVFEIGFLVAFFWRKAFCVFVFVALFFHLINYVMLGIGFPFMTVVFAAFGCAQSLAFLTNRETNNESRKAKSLAGWLVFALLALACVVPIGTTTYLRKSISAVVTFIFPPNTVTPSILAVGCCVGVWMVASQLSRPPCNNE